VNGVPGASIREWPVRERPRERLRSAGPAALSVGELLAILVGSGSEGRTAVDVAAELLRRADGSLRRLASLPAPVLQGVPGVGTAVSARVQAALELGRRLAREGPTERGRIAGPGDVYDRCAPTMRDLAHEEFRVLLLNTQHAVTREVTVTRGVLDGSLIHPREVFKGAIAESAAALLLVHNHPSGDPSPSAEDRAVTRQLAAAGAVLGIPVLDHVVIGDGRFVSFVEAGLLEASRD
jgi:DNA repair protein RadC